MAMQAHLERKKCEFEEFKILNIGIGALDIDEHSKLRGVVYIYKLYDI